MQMGAAIVAAVAGLLGATLGYLGQSLRTRQEHRWAIEAVKRETYAEFLRSISASYAKAEADYAQAMADAKPHGTDKPRTKSPLTDKSAVNSRQSDDPEDAKLLEATTSIELLAERAIHKEARALYDRIRIVHTKIRAGGPDAHNDEIDSVNEQRLGLVKQFKKDLGIPDAASEDLGWLDRNLRWLYTYERRSAGL